MKARVIAVILWYIVFCMVDPDRVEARVDFSLPNFTYSRVHRTGFYDIHGYRQDTSLIPLNLFALGVSLRVPIRSWLRFQITPEFEWGHVDIDEQKDVPLTDGTIAQSLATTQEFRFFSLVPEMHYLLSTGEQVVPFLRGGLSLSLSRVEQIGRRNDTGLLREPIQLQSGFVDYSASVRGIFGLGFDIKNPKGYDFTLSGFMSYGFPLQYHYDDDLPLESVWYWEIFRAFGLSASFLLK